LLHPELEQHGAAKAEVIMDQMCLTCTSSYLPFAAVYCLSAEFEQHGAAKAEVMMDKMTNRSRGFGFVWFNSRAGMEDAIRDKHNSEVDGRRISVKEAIPQEQIPPGACRSLPSLLIARRMCINHDMLVAWGCISVKRAIPQQQVPPGAYVCLCCFVLFCLPPACCR
jgi:hypothetical protein